MRSLCLLVFGCLVGLTVYTYDLKIKTRSLEAQALRLTQKLQDESDLLALAKADVSHLTRPERVEQLARSLLKMEPLSQAQLVSWADASSAWRADVSAEPKDGIAALIERTQRSAPASNKR